MIGRKQMENDHAAYFHILLKYYDKWYNKGLQNGEIPGELLNKVSYAKSGCKCNNWFIDQGTREKPNQCFKITAQSK